MTKKTNKQEIMDRLLEAEQIIKEVSTSISAGYNPGLYLKIKKFLEKKNENFNNKQ